jgi:hypothetical protein
MLKRGMKRASAARCHEGVTMSRTMLYWVSGVALGFNAMLATAAELQFVVEPSYSEVRAREIYQPLVSYIESATGQKITLKTYRNYHVYWADMRKNVGWDIVFDDPHFTDYRMQRFGYVPLVKTAENTQYTLLSRGVQENETVQSFVARPVASMPAPSLGYALILELFPNPIQQPMLVTTAQSWRDAAEIMNGEEADAAMVPKWLQNEYSNLPVITESREFPGAAISVNSSVDATVRQALKTALLKMHEDQKLFEVLAEIGSTQFIEANAEEYRGSEQMLRGFYGY